MDMGTKITIIVTIIVIILIILSVLAINVYNELAKLRNDINNNWNDLNNLINKRFQIAIKAMQNNMTNQNYINLINRQRTSSQMIDIMNNSIELEKMIPTLVLTEEDKNAFNINREQILKAKEVYNNNVLKYNGKIKSFPIFIVALFTGFKKGTYFRSED